MINSYLCILVSSIQFGAKDGGIDSQGMGMGVQLPAEGQGWGDSEHPHIHIS